MKTILILGGARSGKSRLAVEMAQKRGGKVLFVATAEAGDAEMKRRIAAHRRARPAGWKTLETTLDIGPAIQKNIGTARTVIIDCITLLVNNIFEKYGQKTTAARLEKAIKTEIEGLFHCAARTDILLIIVSNEVGLGIIPGDKVSRLYRDMLGRANQVLAGRADEVYLLVAGLPVTVKKAPADIDS